MATATQTVTKAAATKAVAAPKTKVALPKKTPVKATAPRTKAATKAVEQPEATPTTLDIGAFVSAYEIGSAVTARKVRIIGEATDSGMQLAEIVEKLTGALVGAGLAVSPSFVGAVGHYSKAYKIAKQAMVPVDNDDVLHAAYSTATGKVPAKVRDAFIAEFATRDHFNVDHAVNEFLTGIAGILADARSAKNPDPIIVNNAPTSNTETSDDNETTTDKAVKLASALSLSPDNIRDLLTTILSSLNDLTGDDLEAALLIVADFNSKLPTV